MADDLAFNPHYDDLGTESQPQPKQPSPPASGWLAIEAENEG